MFDIDSLVEADVKVPADEAFWAEINKHPLFMSSEELENSESSHVRALQALKYESEDPNANATSYKEEGNYYYQKKEFKEAILCYTKGLLAKPTDKSIACFLFTNRAICNYYLKNYGKCIEDCKFALKCNPAHFKACLKGAQAAEQLNKPNIALDFVSLGLKIDEKSTELLSIQMNALKIQAKLDIQQEKKDRAQTVIRKQSELLYETILKRGIKIDFKMQPVDIPEGVKAEFKVDSQGNFSWPVLLMYPEIGSTDFMVEVDEETRISDILHSFFDPENEPPNWNRNKTYRSDDNSLVVFYEEARNFGTYLECKNHWTIKKLTKQPQFCVSKSLVVVLHVVSKNSDKFYQKWLDIIGRK